MFFMSLSGKAEILDLCGPGADDEFINLAKNFSNDGILYVVLNDREPTIEATFRTKLPQYIVITFYKDYIKSKGIELCKYREQVLDGDHTWMWSGIIDGEKRRVAVFTEQKGAITVVKVTSSKKELANKTQYRSVIYNYPELCSMKNELVFSREVFKGNMFSSIFLFSTPQSPESALKNIRQRFIKAGWQDRIGNKPSNDLCFMTKGNLNATLCASKEEGETTLLVILASFSSLSYKM